MSIGEKCHFCEYERGPHQCRHEVCIKCRHFDMFKVKTRLTQRAANEYARIKKLEEYSEDRSVEFDRATALMVLQDLVRYLYPSNDIFGTKTLVISRSAFEAVRHKYLDGK